MYSITLFDFLFKDYLSTVRVLFIVLLAIYIIYLLKLKFFPKKSKEETQWLIRSSVSPVSSNFFLLMIATFLGIMPFRIILLICIIANFTYMFLRFCLNLKSDDPENLSYLRYYFVITISEIIVLILSFLFWLIMNYFLYILVILLFYKMSQYLSLGFERKYFPFYLFLQKV